MCVVPGPTGRTTPSPTRPTFSLSFLFPLGFFFLAREAIAERPNSKQLNRTRVLDQRTDHHRSAPLRSAHLAGLGFLPRLISHDPQWPPPPARPRPPGSTGWGPPSSGSATRAASSSAPTPGLALVRTSVPIDLGMPQESLPRMGVDLTWGLRCGPRFSLGSLGIEAMSTSFLV